MLFFALCVVPVDLPICLAETAFEQGSTLFRGFSPTRLRREPWERG